MINNNLKTGLTIILIMISFISEAQYEKQKDSLKGLLKIEKKDTLKIKLLLNIGSYYEEQNLDSALLFYNKALRISNKQENKKFNIVIFQMIGDIYYNQNNYDKAIDSYNKSLSEADNILNSNNSNEIKKIKREMSRSFSNLGLAYSDKGEYKKALIYYTKSQEIKDNLLKLAKDSNEIKSLLNGISHSYNNYGTVYYYLGYYDKAVSSYMKSLKIKEKLKDRNGMALCYNNIGSLYAETKFNNKALEYRFKALKIFEELGNKKRISGCYNNIGISFSDLKDFNKAREYYYKSLKIAEEINDKSSISLCCINIGELFTDLGKYADAIEYYQKSYNVSNEIGDKKLTANVLLNMAELNIKLKKFIKSIEYSNRCLNIAKEIGALPIQKKVYHNLSIANDNLGNFKQALEFHKLFKQVDDSIFNLESSKQIKEIEAKYQNEKKQIEIEKLGKEKELQLSENKKQKIIILFITCSLFLVIVFSFFLFKLFIQKKKANILLAQQKEEICAQRDEIESQRDLVTLQKEQIEQIHEEQTDSIRYAERIQKAVLPSDQNIKERISKEFFILFKPKNIVSGDFYFVEKRKNWLLIAVADCTGHGVPGAFMSMLGISFLNEIIASEEIQSANHVLNELRQYVIHSLQQKGIQGEQQDGMDVAFLALNIETNELQFAGANNPLYIIPSNNNEIISIKADTMPIGISSNMPSFKNNIIKVNKDDKLYIFSDGFIDQFGGENRKKFLSKRFKESLLQAANLPMQEQNENLNNIFDHWKGNGEQIDDVTVLGIKI